MRLTTPPLTLRQLVLLDAAVMQANDPDLWPCIGRDLDGRPIPLPLEGDPLLEQGGPWPVGWERVGAPQGDQDRGLTQVWRRADGLEVQIACRPDGAASPTTAQELWALFMVAIEAPTCASPSRPPIHTPRPWPANDTPAIYSVGGLSSDQARRLREAVAALVPHSIGGHVAHVRAHAALLEKLGWEESGWSPLPTD